MQHAGMSAQQDRVALTKAQAHLEEYQTGYNIAEAERARCENELNEERQEFKASQEALDPNANITSTRSRISTAAGALTTALVKYFPECHARL